MPSGSRPQSRARSAAAPTGIAPFFPQPYAGETLYSVVARYRRARQLHRVALGIDLFGMDERVFSPTLPSAVARIAERAGVGRPGAEGLVLQHTGYRYYTATATDELAAKLMTEMLDVDGKPVMLAGQRGAPVGLLPFMRFCPDCLDRMERRDGETHWRLVHQLPIVTVCPDHGGPLRESTIPGTGVIPGFQVPTPANCPPDATPVAAEGSDRAMLTKLARAAAAVAAGGQASVADWRGELRRELQRRSLFTPGGSFRWRPINDEINRALAPIADTFPEVALDVVDSQAWAGMQLKGARPASTDRLLMLRLAFDLIG